MEKVGRRNDRLPWGVPCWQKSMTPVQNPESQEADSAGWVLFGPPLSDELLNHVREVAHHITERVRRVAPEVTFVEVDDLPSDDRGL